MKTSACRMNRYLRSQKKAAELLLMILALLLGSLPLFSQAAVGTILGGVFDSSGGAIAGAGQPLSGLSSNRQFQFGLKIMF